MHKQLFLLILISYSWLFSATMTISYNNGAETIDMSDIKCISTTKDSLIFVEGGTYDMGDHYNEGWDDELPVHSVSVDDFFMKNHEVTQAEFLVFLNSRNVDFNGMYNGNLIVDINTNNSAIVFDETLFEFVGSEVVPFATCPIIKVSWIGACEYANWLSDINGLTPCYSITAENLECDFNTNGYRLPTEAEWEYAARGGFYSFYDFRYSGCFNEDELAEYAWYFHSANSLNPVGTKLPNQIGLYDMSGNVYEFCWDWFSSTYYEISPSDNPLGPESGTYHVSRGGDWNDTHLFNRVTARFSSYAYEAGGYLGFRLVRRD